MRIVHSCMSASRFAGGLFFSIRGLSQAQLRAGMDVLVLAGRDETADPSDYEQWHPAPLVLLNKWRPYKLGYMPGLIPQLMRSSRTDVVHTHGVWSYNCRAGLVWKRRFPNKKWVISPRGMLSSYSIGRSPIKKKIASWLWVSDALRNADGLHALTDEEASDLCRLGVPDHKIEVVPNGVRLPSFMRRPALTGDVLKLITIGRIDPKKNIEFSIDLVKAAVREGKCVSLTVVGWGEESYINSLKQHVRNNGLEDQVKFPGPAYGIEKEVLLREHHAFLISSFSEGMPMAALEAVAYGLPVMSTPECGLSAVVPQEYIFEGPLTMGLWLESLGALETGLRAFNTDTVQRRVFEELQKSVSWNVVQERMMALYE